VDVETGGDFQMGTRIGPANELMPIMCVRAALCGCENMLLAYFQPPPKTHLPSNQILFASIKYLS